MILKGQSTRNKYLQRYIHLLSNRKEVEDMRSMPLFKYMSEKVNSEYLRKKEFRATGKLIEEDVQIDYEKFKKEGPKWSSLEGIKSYYTYLKASQKFFWTNYWDFKKTITHFPTDEYLSLTLETCKSSVARRLF